MDRAICTSLLRCASWACVNMLACGVVLAELPPQDQGVGSPATSQPVQADFSLKDGPTLVKADSLTLNAKERTFEYLGNVEVKHEDLTILSDRLAGSYTDQNQIKELIAKQNVNITKGETIKAVCEKAVYGAGDEIITLSESPELQDQGSILTADIIKILLKENRSVAEGQVRVKVIEEKKDAKPLQLPGRR